MSYLDDIESHGFAVFEDFVNSETIELLFQELANARIDKVKSRRDGKAFGIRDLLNVVPFHSCFDEQLYVQINCRTNSGKHRTGCSGHLFR